MLTTTRQSRLADLIAMVIIILMAVGTVFVFSADANLNQNLDLRRFYNSPPLRRIIFFPLATAILYVVSLFDYRKLRLRSTWLKSPLCWLLVLSIALLILVLFPQIGTEINQARRWLRIPLGPFSVSFQPSELAKWSLILFLAAFCDKFSDSMHLYRERFIPICLLIALVTGLVIIEDFGTAAFITLLAFLILLIGGVKFLHILTLAPFAAVAFSIAIIKSPTRIQRIYAFLDPQKWADSTAYQANQSLIALGSGGIFGKGLGRGICKYGHLPEDTTDFIFAIIGEELGFIGTASVIGLFIAFVVLGFLVILRCRENFGRLLASAIVLAVGVQAAINIGVVTVVLPTKGIPLPFVSAGGTSMLLSAAAVGVLVNIAKQSANTEIPGEI